MTGQKQIKVSETAFHMLKSKAKDPQFRGRGITGVVDKMLFGEFTTRGSGRPKGSKSKTKKVQ